MSAQADCLPLFANRRACFQVELPTIRKYLSFQANLFGKCVAGTVKDK